MFQSNTLSYLGYVYHEGGQNLPIFLQNTGKIVPERVTLVPKR